jgi:broad specificity phosphatase PhoE
MTIRLKTAIEQLNSEELEQVTALAESLARRKIEDDAGKKLSLAWVGCLADAAEKSGVEAAHRANEIRLGLLSKRPSK